MAQPIRAGETKERWAIVAALPVATLSAAGDQAKWILIGISVASVLVGCGVLFGLMQRLVGTHIRALGQTISGMAAGNYEASVPEAERTRTTTSGMRARPIERRFAHTTRVRAPTS